MIALIQVFAIHSRSKGGDAAATFERWRTSPIGPMRDFVLFFEKMGIFIYFSHLEEAECPPHSVH